MTTDSEIRKEAESRLSSITKARGSTIQAEIQRILEDELRSGAGEAQNKEV